MHSYLDSESVFSEIRAVITDEDVTEGGFAFLSSKNAKMVEH